METQDFKQKSQDGNRHLLPVVGRTRKFLLAYPLASKDAVGVSRKRLEFLLTFGVTLSIRSELTVHSVKHLCR